MLGGSQTWSQGAILGRVGSWFVLLQHCSPSPHTSPSCSCTHSEAAAHAVATLAEATLQGGGQIVLSGETAAAVGALTGVQDANGKTA